MDRIRNRLRINKTGSRSVRIQSYRSRVRPQHASLLWVADSIGLVVLVDALPVTSCTTCTNDLTVILKGIDTTAFITMGDARETNPVGRKSKIKKRKCVRESVKLAKGTIYSPSRGPPFQDQYTPDLVHLGSVMT